MTRFVELKKMSKKAQKEINNARRQTWDCSPVTRKVENKKHYVRNKKPYARYDDSIGLLLWQNSFSGFAGIAGCAR